METNENLVLIKYINSRKGLIEDYNCSDCQEFIKKIFELINISEPVRIQLDEIEMKQLFDANGYMEITFTKPVIIEHEPSDIFKFVYFVSGNYGNDYNTDISYFFIAKQDGQFIQSPFAVAKNTRSEIESYLNKLP